MLNGLGKFELARRLLNHTAVVSLTAPYLVDKFRRDDNKLTADRLGAYASDLHTALASETIEGFPVPVLPVVDIAHLLVSHTTCTGSTTVSVDHRGGFHWTRHTPTSPDAAVRDRLLEGLERDGFYREDPAWRVFLDTEDWKSVGIEPLEAGIRLVSRRLGVYALYRTPYFEDRLYAVNAVYSDYKAMPEDDEWMEEAPAALRALVLAEEPDSVL